LVGLVVGIGSEYMFAPNWMARVEYLYENFGSFSVPTNIAPDLATVSLNDVQKIRVGINYKFTP
jgi:outer membrane immunogenic protein